jgi:Rrf2 family protein
MIKLNRTTEYGLMALRHMSQKSKKGTELTSAREVSDVFGLPFEITAKTLQRMKDVGLIQSAQGARGGYVLQRPLEEITLADFLEMMEGPQSVVACAGQAPVEPVNCEYSCKCEIRGLMSNLNSKVKSFLGGIRLADLSESDFVSSDYASTKDALEP